MTEPDRPLDPLDELASAILDGEATPAEQARAGEPAVAERLARFERVAAAFGEPVEVTDAERDAAVRAALAAGAAVDDGPVDELAARRRRTPARRWLPAAAAILVVAGAIGLVAVAGDDDDPASTVAAQLDEDEESGDDQADVQTRGAADGGYAEGDTEEGASLPNAAGATAGSAAALGAGSDLGAFATVDELAAAVAVASSYDELSLDDSAATTTSLAPACPLQRDGEILFHATATVDGVPLVVFVVATPDGRRLLAYALDGCDERYDLAA